VGLTFAWGVDALDSAMCFPTQQLDFLLMRSKTIVTALSIANSSDQKMIMKVTNTINFHTFS
jgi:hypothetical protein